MTTAQRKAAKNTATETPAAVETKPRLSEFERAESAYLKAKAKSDKSGERVADAEGKIAELRLTHEADKRTSDYLFMHPALAERRSGGGPAGSTGGEAIGHAPPVEEKLADAPADTPDDEWEAAAPAAPAPVAVAEVDPFGPATNDDLDPFGGQPDSGLDNPFGP